MKEQENYINQTLSLWLKVVKLGLFGLLILGLLRIALVLTFKGQLGSQAEIDDYFLAFYQGMRFDGRVIGLLSLLLLITSLFIRSQRFIEIAGNLFLLITISIGIGNIAFFKEYHDQYNFWIFGVYYDDFSAILKSIWGMYPVIWMSLGSIALVYCVCWLQNLWLRTKFLKMKMSNIKSVILGILILAIMGLAARGSLGHRPLQMKDVAITKDEFLNKTILNAYYALHYAIQDHQTRTSPTGNGGFFKDADLTTALERLYPGKTGNKISDYLLKEVQDSPKLEPKDIFLIVMESQDSWPLLKKYRDFGINPNLIEFADNGLWVKQFLSAGHGTIESLNALITGIPDVGVFLNYQPTSIEPYPTAIAKQFENLGYETNFYYGGYLSWQRIGDFAKNQGFDNVYGGTVMGKWVGNEWGVEDQQLFDFIKTKLDSSKKTFNLIMTTSNHPRYTVNLKEEACEFCEIPEKFQELYDGSDPLEIFGHFKYADKCVGDFIKSVEKSHPSSLFAITGDHWSRHFLNAKPNLYERKSVPLILYGEGIKQYINPEIKLAGSHLDIAPTLINMIGPKGQKYHTFGRNIFDLTEKPVSYGVQTEVSPKKMKAVGLEDKAYQDLQGIAWWMVMKGDEI